MLYPLLELSSQAGTAEESRQSGRLNLPTQKKKKIWENQEIISSQPPKETGNILMLAASPGRRQGPTAAIC